MAIVLSEEIIAFMASSTSVVSTGLLLTCYTMVKQLQVMEFKMVAMMCLGDFLQTIAITSVILWYKFNQESRNWVSATQIQFVCNLFGFLEAFGSQMSFIWTFVICFLLKHAVMDPDFNIEMWWRYIMVMGLAEPLLLACMYIMDYQTYGAASPSLNQHDCFISTASLKGSLTQALTYFVPLWVIIIYNLISMKQIYSHVQNMPSCHDVIKNKVLHIFWYPGILLLCYSIITAYRVCTEFNMNPQFLVGPAFFFVNIAGTLNVIVYGTNNLTSKIKIRWGRIDYLDGSENDLEVLTPPLFESQQFILSKKSYSTEFSVRHNELPSSQNDQ